MLKKEGLVGDDFLQMIMQWRHTSGFSVHNQVRIARMIQKGRRRWLSILSGTRFP
jgi:hypothetical protein